jgi:hypothetical protein
VVKKEDLPLSRADGIAYYSTGIGKDSREVRIEGFTLRLSFAEGKTYLANVDVTIQDAQGKSVFQARSSGPWLYVDLTPGTYQVKAQVEGRSVTRKGVEVAAGKTLRVLIHFPAKK